MNVPVRIEGFLMFVQTGHDECKLTLIGLYLPSEQNFNYGAEDKLSATIQAAFAAYPEAQQAIAITAGKVLTRR